MSKFGLPEALQGTNDRLTENMGIIGRSAAGTSAAMRDPAGSCPASAPDQVLASSSLAAFLRRIRAVPVVLPYGLLFSCDQLPAHGFEHSQSILTDYMKENSARMIFTGTCSIACFHESDSYIYIPLFFLPHLLTL